MRLIQGGAPEEPEPEIIEYAVGEDGRTARTEDGETLDLRDRGIYTRPGATLWVIQ